MINLRAMKAHIIKRVSARAFYDDFFAGLVKWGPGWTDLFCPFHNPQWREQRGKSPSFSIHVESGAFQCHGAGCGLHGQSIVNFYDQFYGLPFDKTLRKLYRRWVQPTIPQKLVDEWHAQLIDSPSVLKYITDARGLSKNTIKRFQLGFDGSRITIPIYDRFGMAVDIRRYDFTKTMKVKICSYKDGYGGGRLFPIDNLLAYKGGRVLLCEGEWDAMLAIDRGYRAITVTSGAGSWPDDPEAGTDLFKDKPVRIVFDVNDIRSDGSLSDAGQIAAQKIAGILAPVARSVKVVKLPIKKAGGDITDWFMKFGKTKADLDAVIDGAPVFSRNSVATGPVGHGDLPRIRLDEAADSRYYFKPVAMDCLISGKDLSPYLAPKKVKVTTTDPETGDESSETMDVDTKANKNILSLINCPNSKVNGTLAEIFDVPREGSSFETMETFNMEELRIIPAIDLRDFEGMYTIRRAVYVGHGLESNRTYRMEGYTLPDPDRQSCVHVITGATPVQDTVENFKLTDEVLARLREKFVPTGDVDEHMKSVTSWLARHVTKIKMRPDLHIAVDLVFHSVLTFNFNGEEVNKGWLELLVIGDTRCGKGYVAERLSRFYKLGETVTGENCSFAGLIGGLQKNNDHWFVTWGKIPLADKRLVIVDEASAIDLTDMGKFSRVRSEGIAEIIKIVTERTRARTRLIWLSNPRSGRPINTYNNGVEAISELFGNTEDVARLDFALTVAASEVPSRVINTPPAELADGDRFEQSDFTNLVLWAWSRKPDQIEFTKRATQMILECAIRMGKKFSAAIPLIQAENVRIKLAKLAAATAARCFSSDESGEKLIVKSHHVQFAHDFLLGIYAKPSMGYDMFSSTSINRDNIANDEAVVRTIHSLKKYALDFVDGMLAHASISHTDISDFTGVDRFEAQNIIGKLVRLRCLAKRDEFTYTKQPGFVQLLRNVRPQFTKEGE